MKNSIVNSALLSAALAFAGCAANGGRKPDGRTHEKIPSLFLGNEILYTLPSRNIVAETRPDTGRTHCTIFYLFSRNAATETVSDCSAETQESIADRGIESARSPAEEAGIVAGNIAEQANTARTIGCYLSDSMLERNTVLPGYAQEFQSNFCLK